MSDSVRLLGIFKWDWDMKRLADIFFAFFGLIILVPVFGLVSLLILLFMGKPIFFTQPRIGLGSTVFTIYKFRTMNEPEGFESSFSDDEVRITGLGKFLRSTSIDELPELWNVLKGEMSLVGPRPLLVEYGDRYTSEQNRRHNVRPGLTGWAQINGRNVISWEDRLKLDVWYVDNQSLYLDVKIIIFTIYKVISRDGIYSADGELMKKFQGTKKN